MTDWPALAQRASRASHDLVGWIFWDERAIANYAALGVPEGRGYYAATRFGPLDGAGNDAISATAYSINPFLIGMAMDIMRADTDAASALLARDAAVIPGLDEIHPEIAEGIAPMADALWAVVDGLHNGSRALFAAHRGREERAADTPALSAWLAINCLREWRGDTHWALCAAADLNIAEVGLLHNVMVDYDEAEWIVRSRGASDEEIAAGWDRLEQKGFVSGRVFTDEGRAYRHYMEQRTDEISAQMWQALGEDLTVRFCDLMDPHHDACIARIDRTAGKNWMPAARHT